MAINLAHPPTNNSFFICGQFGTVLLLQVGVFLSLFLFDRQ